MGYSRGDVMSTTKEELFACSLRKQISYLEGLLKELEADRLLKDKDISSQIQNVEMQLRDLRNHL